MWDEIRKKLLQLIDEKRITQKWLAEKLKTSKPLVSNWIKGSRVPNQSSIRKITNVLIEKDFLEDKSEVKFIDTDNTIKLPIVAHVPAGYPEFSEKDIDGYMELPRLLVKGAKYIIECCGDSMTPSITKGDLCLIRPETEPINGKVMLVRVPHGYIIKRVRVKDGSIELHSDNHEFKSYKAKEVKIVGQVVKIIKTVD